MIPPLLSFAEDLRQVEIGPKRFNGAFVIIVIADRRS